MENPLSINYFGREVVLHLPPGALHWLGALATSAGGGLAYTDIGLIALALGWQSPPWMAGAEEALRAAAGERSRWESYIRGAGAQSDPAAKAEGMAELRRATAAHQAAVAALDALRVVDIPRDPAERRALADRVRAWLAPVPEVVITSWGVALAGALQSHAMQGWAEYARLEEQGFSTAPVVTTSSGASEPAAVNAGTR